MAIVMKFKASKITADSKSKIIDKLAGYSIWGGRNGFDRYGRYMVGKSDGAQAGLVRLYSLEKHNRKVKVSKRTITRGKRKGEDEVTREVVRQSGWVAYYYDIPASMVDRDGTRQNDRTFVVKLKG